jgi:hypothetical protein
VNFNHLSTVIGSHFMATTTVGVVRGLPHKILNSKHVLSTAPRVNLLILH